MCDYCDCRSEPEIAELSAEHEALLELTRVLRRDADGDRRRHLVAELTAILFPHSRREEAGLFAALRRAGTCEGYVDGLERDHGRIDALLLRAGDEPAAARELVDLLEDHILREETDAYPAAHQMLTPADWARFPRARQLTTAAHL